MKNILSIYEFNLPFISSNNEYLKYNTILEDIKKLLIYDEIYISIKKEKSKNHEIVNINFKKWYIRIIYYKDFNSYFIPTFQLDLFSEDILSKNFLEEFCYIFYSIDYQDYIFEFISNKIKISNSKLLYLNDLKKAFKKYNYNKLKNILDSNSKDYIDEKLRVDSDIRNSFLYLIYTCFNLYRNIYLSENWIKDLEKIVWNKIDDLYYWNLLLYEKRLWQVKKINLENFKRYKYLLDGLFSWLQKIL